jgi:hypothetical protein
MSDEEISKIIGKAKAKVDRLQRPGNVGPQQWRTMCIVLKQLCRYAHFKEVTPSQAKLALKTGLARSTVQRSLDLAEAQRYISRELHDGGHRWEGTLYRLNFLQNIDSQKVNTLTRSESDIDSLQGTRSSPSVRTGPPQPDSLRESVSDDDDAATPTGPTSSTPLQEVRPNDFPGPCLACHGHVASGEGRLQRDPFGKWGNVHLGCYGKPATGLSRRQWEHQESIRALNSYVPPRERTS